MSEPTFPKILVPGFPNGKKATDITRFPLVSLPKEWTTLGKYESKKAFSKPKSPENDDE